MLSVLKSRPLLAFPEVKILDILFAGALLEILATSCVIIVMLILAWVSGIDARPIDMFQAALAFGAALLLGMGLGILNGLVALALPSWFTGYALLTIALWVTSSVLFVPDALPASIRDILAYHPVLQVIEWMRSAYYEGYGNLVLDKGY